MKRLLVGGALFAATLGGIGAPASAQQYPPSQGNVTLNISITVINFGGNVNLTFIGCLIGESVAIGFNGVSSITSCFSAGGGASRHLALAGGGGMALASVTAPSEPGTYTITMTGLTSGLSASRTVTVNGPSAATKAAALAPSGGPSAAAATQKAAAPSAAAKSASSKSTSSRATSKSASSKSASSKSASSKSASAPAAASPAAAPVLRSRLRQPPLRRPLPRR